MSGIKQGYRGWADLNGIYLPVRPGSTHRYDPNWDIPYPIDNSEGEFLAIQQMKFPVVEFQPIPSFNWFNSANLAAWFVTRTPVLDDLTAIGSATLSDNTEATGYGTMLISGAKAAGFTLSINKTQPMSFRMRLAGTSATVADPQAMPTPPAAAQRTTWQPLRPWQCEVFDDSEVPVAVTDVIGVVLEFDVGLTPNPELNGLQAPTEQNAGMPTAFITLQTNGGAPLADSTGIRLRLPEDESDNYVDFVVRHLRCLNPDDRQLQAGRVVRSFRYKVMKDVLETIPLLTIEQYVDMG